MKQDKKSSDTAAKAADNKQIEMTVDGCSVRINFIPHNEKATKLESVKRMILNGLAKT